MSTAIQNIERAKGAKGERKWAIATIRRYLTLYPKDLILNTLLDEFLDHDKQESQ